MRIIKKTLKILAIGLFLYGLFFVCWLTIASLLLGYFSITEASFYRNQATPLSYEVIDDLCTKFSLSSSDSRCQHAENIYTPDFSDVLRAALSAPDMTFERVEEQLGLYRFEECSPLAVTSEHQEYFVCKYDLSGDRIYIIVVYFYSNGDIMEFLFN